MIVLSVSQQGGLADFQRVQDAVNFVRENNTQRVIIFIRASIYSEKVTIPKNKPFITFQGEEVRSTIIRWYDRAYDVDKSGKNLGTLLSASIAVNSDDFSTTNMYFENAATFQENAVYRQAVALRISGDRAIFMNCGFYGHQDTLYDHEGRLSRCFDCPKPQTTQPANWVCVRGMQDYRPRPSIPWACME